MKKGDVVLIPFPFTDLTGSKYRPALILATALQDIIVAFITTQLRFYKDTDIKLLPTLENGLKKPSVLLLNKIATLEKKLITGKIGELSENDLTLVDKNLIKVFQIKHS